MGGETRSHGKSRASEITGKEFISNNREKFLSNFFRHSVYSLHINVHLTKKIGWRCTKVRSSFVKAKTNKTNKQKNKTPAEIIGGAAAIAQPAP